MTAEEVADVLLRLAELAEESPQEIGMRIFAAETTADTHWRADYVLHKLYDAYWLRSSGPYLVFQFLFAAAFAIDDPLNSDD